MDRRALFFIGAAVVCLVLTPITPASLRYVGIWIAITYAVLAVLSFLDDRARRMR